ncbi:BlaI/MecI/CopY family transcriptional regulator [Algoriphagus sanaruensis]|uniref:Penicillinase repressor n=1 Tax=Algoriphagus sanaruensis TaxID=1727163 RepID=A0A142ERI6_9BACT|nr:BlaI/MecI/CopY family transcriptional regulator [Algoriphagus sanaruensis]AMQ57741.1 penicillinase repressor [Algoriphagus sanaruensis]
MKLSGAEEELMNFLWDLKKAYLKDLLEKYPEPKPALTTISTLLKRMQDKNFVDYESEGKARLYFPLVSKEAYFGKHLQGLIKNFFNDSPAQFASFFATETSLTEAQLQELKSMIDDQLNRKK